MDFRNDLKKKQGCTDEIVESFEAFYHGVRCHSIGGVVDGTFSKCPHPINVHTPSS